MICSRIALLALVWCLPATVSAHIGAGAGDTDILLRPGTDDVWLKAPWGYVQRVTEDDWRWVCHEVFSATNESLLPNLSQAADGTLLGVVGVVAGVVVEGVSLYRSTDGGCSWAPTVGLEGRMVVGAAFDPEDSSVAVAITANLDMGAGVPSNGVARSTDGGLTWSIVEEWDGRIMSGVEFGPGGRAWALAAQIDPEDAWLLRSDDQGLTWQALPVPTEGVDTVLVGGIAAVAPNDPDAIWLSFDGPQSDALFGSIDGGITFTPITGVPAAFLDLSVTADGALWLTGGAREVWRSTGGAAWSQVAAPQSWGGAHDSRGFWAAVNGLSDDRAVIRIADDGGITDELFTLDLAGPLECPADSDVALVCAPLWDALYENLERQRPRPGDDDDDDDDSAPAPVPDGACAGCSGGAAILPLLILPWRRRALSSRRPRARGGGAPAA